MHAIQIPVPHMEEVPPHRIAQGLDPRIAPVLVEPELGKGRARKAGRTEVLGDEKGPNVALGITLQRRLEDGGDGVRRRLGSNIGRKAHVLIAKKNSSRYHRLNEKRLLCARGNMEDVTLASARLF